MAIGDEAGTGVDRKAVLAQRPCATPDLSGLEQDYFVAELSQSVGGGAARCPTPTTATLIETPS